MILSTLKIHSLYLACSLESGVVGYGACQDEALNNLTDELRQVQGREATGFQLVTEKRGVV